MRLSAAAVMATEMPAVTGKKKKALHRAPSSSRTFAQPTSRATATALLSQAASVYFTASFAAAFDARPACAALALWTLAFTL